MANYYSKNASTLCSQYNAMAFDDVNSAWLNLLPACAGRALDIGAGSGRDARALSERGWQVVAAEPNREMLAQTLAGTHLSAGAQKPAHAVQWLDDTLPALPVVKALGLKFDLILLSAVWMHVAEADRADAVANLAGLLNTGGLLVMSLRQGPADAEREFHPISAAELKTLAAARELALISEGESHDRLKREGVFWQTLVFRKCN